ncbi:MAG: ubiquinone biosynthesis protein COQ4 [Deltaproteobacteria bacterium]|nr:ubiquinone biosynthesis protein COQ4 [Deltaproteobacteria bacterium]
MLSVSPQNSTTQTPSTADSAILQQAAAVQVAQHGSAWERALLAARAGSKLLRDPEDTVQVFLLSLVLNRRALAPVLGRMAAEEGGLELIADRPSIDSSAVDYQRLRELVAGTLGREYVRFLDDNGLDPDMFQEPPGLPPVPGFVSRRLRQSHDIWHVVTGYGPDVPGEVALQAFTYAQLGAPSALVITLIGCSRWALVHPGLIAESMRAYRRGQRASFLAAVRWEELWEAPLPEVRERLGLS